MELNADARVWVSGMGSVQLPERGTNDLLKSFLRDERGATAIEYGLIAAGISVAIITVVGQFGSKLNTTFTSVKDALN
jgi:pilus assembly protein Flp/PilA